MAMVFKWVRDLAALVRKARKAKNLKQLNRRAVQLYHQGQYSQAVSLAEEVLALARQLWGEEHPNVASSLNNLAVLYKSQGRLTEAEPLYQEALAMRQRLFSGDHPDVAQSLDSVAGLYESQGRLDAAESLCEEALAMRQRLFPHDHPDVAGSLNSLAGLYESQGRLKAAEPLYEEALAMRQRLFPGNHRDVAGSLNNLAGLYKSQGRLSAATPLLEEVLAITKHLFPHDHPHVALSLNNLAFLYKSQGRLDAAQPLIKEALAMRQRLFPHDHPDVAGSLGNLAGLYKSQGCLAEAEPLLEEALAMTKRLFPYDHPHVALTLNNLSFLYKAQGRLDTAESLYEEALAMRQRLFPNDHPDVATSLNNLAGLYKSQGRLAEAEPLLEEALAMSKRLFPDDHPTVAKSLNNLATLLAATSRYSEALERMKEAAAIENQLIGQAFTASSESDRLTYLQLFRKTFEAFISLVSRHLHLSPQAAQAALDLVLQRKALSAAALAALNQAIYSGRYPHLKPQLEKLRELSDQIIHFTFTQPQPELIGQLQAEHDKLQKQLASQVPEIQLQEQPVDRRAVALELPEGTTLVEFVYFHIFNFCTSAEPKWQLAHYVAFVLPANQPDEVQMIDLGEAEHIDRLIQVFRQSLSLEGNNLGNRLDMGGDDDDSEFLQYNPAAGIELRQVLFDPIRPYLSQSKHLLLSPDGGLNLVPFQILPIDETGQQLLMDEYTISYLSAGRDILRSKIQTTRPASTPLVIADPDFDLVDLRARHVVPLPPQLTPDLLNTLANKPFKEAPGTRLLGEGVAKMLQVSPYLGKEALESHLTTSECPNILLIATHGVFLPDSPHSPPQPPLLRGEQDWFSFNRLSGGKVENPMLRSGLAFAGANTWLKGGTLPPNAGKGLVFAQDVAALDLWATELAVLSACNTAIGDIKIGEGVFGLRRAFAVAGAKTLVMSLWSVPDRATALLMQHFFTNLHEGLGRAEALQEAQNYIRTITVKDLQQSDLGQKVLDELVEKNLLPQDLQFCQSDKPLAHPFFWGAWVCQGDTTPISSEILH
jgi:CHAT domain-containing protein/tetratricopeptide (TPR) repeat protein